MNKLLCMLGIHKWISNSESFVCLPGSLEVYGRCRCLRCNLDVVRKI